MSNLSNGLDTTHSTAQFDQVADRDILMTYGNKGYR
jgi:hypothetical protein